MSESNVTSQEQLEELYREGRISPEEYEELRRAMSGTKPEKPRIATEPSAAPIGEDGTMALTGPSQNQIILTLTCTFLQILGLVSIIAFELPVITGIAGFAAIVNHFVVKKEGWVNQLSLTAAICGFFLILTAIAASAS